MKRFPFFIFFCMLYCCTLSSFAQPAKDSTALINSPKPLRHYNSFKTYVLPSALVLYGALSLNSKPLVQWNENVKNEIGAGDGKQHTQIDNYLQYTTAVASHVISLMGVKPRHRLFDRLMIDGMTAGLCTSVVLIVKNNSHEIRPDGTDDYSFPSNHVATAFASAELLRQEYGDISPWYGVAGYAVAGLTGYLRMYNNRHWFGDVLAGAGIGIVSAKLAVQLFPIAKKILFGNKTPFAAIMPSYQNGAIGLRVVSVLP